eukprot:gene31548-35614_t
MKFAHAPYSKFPVGAAIRADDGRIYTGANIENLSFPQGWCAEPTAIGCMIMGGGKKIIEMAVIAEKLALCQPCGGCRQKISEFASADTKIYLCDELQDGHPRMKAAVDLLVERLNGLVPRHAIVLGSGLGSLVNEVRDAVRVPYADLPGFPLSGVSGHAGEIVAGYLGRTPVIMLA